MGTSNAYGGPGTGTPLIPSWLGPAGGDGAGPDGGEPDGGGADPNSDNGESRNPAQTASPSPARIPIPPPAAPQRFSNARGNFSRFTSSGGSDRRSLGRGVSRYVSTSSGGSRQAAQRMGASRTAGANFLGFLSQASAGGAREALRALKLEHLAGRPIDEIFLALADYVCPDGGTIDEGIARSAFVEMIAELPQYGITDLDGLSTDQVQTIFELYATNAIEARICNDVATNVIQIPDDAAEALSVQGQLHDFILRGVSDALTSARAGLEALTPERALDFVTHVYEQAFSILQSLGDEESDK